MPDSEPVTIAVDGCRRVEGSVRTGLMRLPFPAAARSNGGCAPVPLPRRARPVPLPPGGCDGAGEVKMGER
ncbi:hypothetical protein NUM3379_40510 [Kineococcus sp. NUM-3379]